MAKQKATGVKRPTNPRSLGEWEAGNWQGATEYKVKYYYCKKGIETLASIASTLSGAKTGNAKYPKYQANMTWHDITRLNYGTDTPTEVNWYLEHFNGCGRRVTADRANYGFDPKDDRPWLWIPTQTVLPPIVITIKRNTKRQLNLPPPHNEFTQSVDNRFKDIDKDKDGFLSKKEIDRALGDPMFVGNHGAAVATLKKHLGDFEEMSDDEWGDENDGVTRADITAYDRLRLINPNNNAVQIMENMYSYAKGKITGTSKQLFAGPIDPLGVRQGMIGDCWFLAPIVGIANIPHRRDEIKKMIKTLPNGNYEVKFPGISKSITVTPPTDSEIGVFSGAGVNGLWLSVLEKTYGASVNRDAYFFIDDSHYDAADAGQFLSKGIEIMTGHSVDADTLVAIVPKTIELMTLSNKLMNAINNRKVVTAGIRGNLDFWSDNYFRNNGLPMGHAYTVMGFNSATQTIHIRNPWGEGGAQWPAQWPIQSGVFSMSLSSFWDYFSDIAFEE